MRQASQPAAAFAKLDRILGRFLVMNALVSFLLLSGGAITVTSLARGGTPLPAAVSR
jgi:hypothetical protein